MRQTAKDLVAAAVRAALDAAFPGWHASATLEMERPKEEAHGDYATSVALRLAKPLRKAPLDVARAIAERVAVGDAIAAVEVAAPGFVNVRLAPDWLARQVEVIAAAGDRYGRSSGLAGQRVQIEFVSANPTGPMTIANARGGPLGDVLASVLSFAGADVQREYYVNDAGTQIEIGRAHV